MSNTIRVQARTGIRVPRADNARKYITDSPVDVPDNVYYRRRLTDGDLVEVKTTTTKKGEK